MFAFWTGVCRGRLKMGLNTKCMFGAAEMNDVQKTDSSFPCLFVLTLGAEIPESVC